MSNEAIKIFSSNFEYKSSSDIAILLRKRRLELRLKQAELANILQVSQSRISKLEDGKYGDNLIFWLSLLEALEFDLRTLKNSN